MWPRSGATGVRPQTAMTFARNIPSRQRTRTVGRTRVAKNKGLREAGGGALTGVATIQCGDGRRLWWWMMRRPLRTLHIIYKGILTPTQKHGRVPGGWFMPRLLRVVMPRLLYDPPDLHLYAQQTQDKAGCRQVRVQVQGRRPCKLPSRVVRLDRLALPEEE